MLLEFDDCRQETIFLLKYSDIMNQEWLLLITNSFTH
jgi:hypothetical protein